MFRYLKETLDLGIIYWRKKAQKISGMKSLELPVSHCDADWAGSVKTQRSTTGYVFTLAGGAFTWKRRLSPREPCNIPEQSTGLSPRPGRTCLFKEYDGALRHEGSKPEGLVKWQHGCDSLNFRVRVSWPHKTCWDPTSLEPRNWLARNSRIEALSYDWYDRRLVSQTTRQTAISTSKAEIGCD